MTQEQITQNIEHLQKNCVTVDVVEYTNGDTGHYLYFRTPAGGDFGIQVDELCKREVVKVLKDFDVNEETLLWWNGKHPFKNIKDLYLDIEKWKKNFLKIAKKMLY